MWMLLGILVVGALGGVCMAALRNVSGDVGGGMGRDYMEKEWGITENKKEQKDKMGLLEQIKKPNAAMRQKSLRSLTVKLPEPPELTLSETNTRQNTERSLEQVSPRNSGGSAQGALTEACIECAKEAGYTQLELDVVSDNASAISLYKKVGFVEYGRNPKGFNSRISGYQELIYMKLDL